MKYIIDHDLHIHSQISACSSDPEQTTGRILEYAKDDSLKRIVLTDHYWNSDVEGASSWYKVQNFERVSGALPLPQYEGIDFLFGVETDMNKFFAIGVSGEDFKRFDFIIIPTTHLHMVGFTITEEDASSCEGRAKVWIEKIEHLLSLDLPFHKIGIPHLACGLIAPNREDYLKTLELLPEEKLEQIFKRCAQVGVGIELNSGDMSFADSEADTVLRIFRIAKAQGCKFYLGSDAHHPKAFESVKAIFERAVALLELTEDDKFVLKT